MRKFQKVTLFLLSMFIVTLMNCQFAYAAAPTYAEEDLKTLEKISSENNNNEILNWDFTNPETIDEIIWELMGDGVYHIVSMDLSNLDVTGNIDLTSCKYLEDVFFSNSLIESVVLPNDILTLGSSSFRNCSNLLYVEINSDSIDIESYCFSGCVNLRTLLNTDSIVSIGKNAFNNCNKVAFYGSDSSSFAAKYASSNRINFSKNYVVTATCYIGIMTNSKVDTVDLTSDGVPYHTGYITTDYGTFYADKNGKIEFFIDLGSKSTAKIDGATALERDVVFNVLYNNYEVSTEDNAIGIIVCNYVKDSIINGKDFAALTRYQMGSDKNEEYCYDLDGDGEISDFDRAYFEEFLIVTADKAYHSWK